MEAIPSMVGNVRTLGLYCQIGAGFQRFAIQVNRTGSTLTGIAGNFRTSESKLLADEVDKQRTRVNIPLNLLAVNRH